MHFALAPAPIAPMILYDREARTGLNGHVSGAFRGSGKRRALTRAGHRLWLAQLRRFMRIIMLAFGSRSSTTFNAHSMAWSVSPHI